MKGVFHAVSILVKEIRDHLLKNGELEQELIPLILALYRFPEIDITDMIPTEQTIPKDIFKKAFGKSFRQFQHDMKMKKALALLLRPGFSIKEVCYTIGYKNVSNFSESFKKYYGYPPSRLKKLT